MNQAEVEGGNIEPDGGGEEQKASVTVVNASRPPSESSSSSGYRGRGYKLNESERKMLADGNRCFKCYQPGHMARGCISPPATTAPQRIVSAATASTNTRSVSGSCFQLATVTSPTRNGKNSSSRLMVTIGNIEARDYPVAPLIQFCGEILGKTCRVLLDCGASLNFIATRAEERLNWTPSKLNRALTVSMADGQEA